LSTQRKKKTASVHGVGRVIPPKKMGGHVLRRRVLLTSGENEGKNKKTKSRQGEKRIAPPITRTDQREKVIFIKPGGNHPRPHRREKGKKRQEWGQFIRKPYTCILKVKKPPATFTG